MVPVSQALLALYLLSVSRHQETLAVAATPSFRQEEEVQDVGLLGLAGLTPSPIWEVALGCQGYWPQQRRVEVWRLQVHQVLPHCLACHQVAYFPCAHCLMTSLNLNLTLSPACLHALMASCCHCESCAY